MVKSLASILESAKPKMVTALTAALGKFGLDPALVSPVEGKAMVEEAGEKKDQGVVHYFSTGGLGIDGEVLLTDGADTSYLDASRSVIFNHQYDGLQVGKCMWFKKDERGWKAWTVFALHTLGQALRSLYCDDVGDGPIARAWSVDYIPCQVERPGSRGWAEALATALRARPDLEGVKDKIKSIVTRWVMLGYSATPMGINPEAVSVWAGKGVSEDTVKALETVADALAELEIEVPEVTADPPATVAEPVITEPPAEPEEKPETEEEKPEDKPEEKPETEDKPETAETEKNETDAGSPEAAGAGGNAGEPGPGSVTGSGIPEGGTVGEAGDGVTGPAEGKGKKNGAGGEGQPAKAEGGEVGVVVAPVVTEPESEINLDELVLADTTPAPVVAESAEINIEGLEIDSEAGEPPVASVLAEGKSFDPGIRALELAKDRESRIAGAKGKGIDELYSYYGSSHLIVGEVNEWMAAMTCDWLISQMLVDPEKELTLFINSPGGSVDAGFAIIDTMNYIPNPVRTIALGEICSMGLLIFMAGNERIISENATVLSHRFWTFTGGSQAELEAVAVQFKIVHNRIVNHYIAYSAYQSKEEIEDILLKTVDVYLTPKQAIKHGLADRILDDSVVIVEPIQITKVGEDVDSTASAKGKSVGTVTVSVEPAIQEIVEGVKELFRQETEKAKRAFLLTSEGRDKVQEACERVAAILEELEGLADCAIAEPEETEPRAEKKGVKPEDKPGEVAPVAVAPVPAPASEMPGIDPEQVALAIQKALSPISDKVGDLARSVARATGRVDLD